MNVLDTNLTIEEMIELINCQIFSNWGRFREKIEETEDKEYFAIALERLRCCLEGRTTNRSAKFDFGYSTQYVVFLYYLSNTFYQNGKIEKATSIYYLNKIMHSVELFYEIELPRHFFCEHPLGAVMGKAKYGDNFFFYQGCTVGGNRRDGQLFYPKLGDNVTMYSNSKILGDCTIGNNVIMSANSYVKDLDVPDDTIVFGQYPNCIFKSSKNILMETVKVLWPGED